MSRTKPNHPRRVKPAADWRPDYSALRVLTNDVGDAVAVSTRNVRRLITPLDRYVAPALLGPSGRALKRVSGGRLRWSA